MYIVYSICIAKMSLADIVSRIATVLSSWFVPASLKLRRDRRS